MFISHVLDNFFPPPITQPAFKRALSFYLVVFGLAVVKTRLPPSWQ